jgi:hypothetical protein
MGLCARLPCRTLRVASEARDHDVPVLHAGQPESDTVTRMNSAFSEFSRYATACCTYRLTFIRCLSIKNPPPGGRISEVDQCVLSVYIQGQCVCWLFIFKDTEPSPLQDSFSVRQQGGLPGPHY